MPLGPLKHTLKCLYSLLIVEISPSIRDNTASYFIWLNSFLILSIPIELTNIYLKLDIY